jgi:hypothetical protein
MGFGIMLFHQCLCTAGLVFFNGHLLTSHLALRLLPQKLSAVDSATGQASMVTAGHKRTTLYKIVRVGMCMCATMTLTICMTLDSCM